MMLFETDSITARSDVPVSVTPDTQVSLKPVCKAVLALLLVAASQTAGAAEKAAHTSLVTIIEAIEQGWEQADGTPFREHYLDVDGTRYVESGGQNTGLSDLIEHHVEAEGDALEGLDLSFSIIETHVEGEFAWAIADVEVTATVKNDGRTIHNRGYVSFLFRSVDGEWKVIHTHSSSRPVKKAESEHKH